MGINRFSLYAAFGNKEALFVKAMTRFTAVLQAHLDAALAAGPARDGVERLLKDSVAIFTAAEGPGLCFITQGPLTSPEVSEATQQLVARQQSTIERALGERLDRAVWEGELADDGRAAGLAQFYGIVIQGLALQAHHGGAREALAAVVEVAMARWP